MNGLRNDLGSAHVLQQMAQDHLRAAIMHLEAYRGTWWETEAFNNVNKVISDAIKLLEENL